jgi:hypothetical protein
MKPLAQTDEQLRSQIDDAKSKLLCGGLYTFRRGYGASTAIMEMCHDFGAGNCVVLLPNLNLKYHAENHWRWMYGADEEPPTMIVYSDGSDDRKLMGMGAGKRLFIDGADHMERCGPRADICRTFDSYCGVY